MQKKKNAPKSLFLTPRYSIEKEIGYLPFQEIVGSSAQGDFKLLFVSRHSFHYLNAFAGKEGYEPNDSLYDKNKSLML